MTTKQQIKNRLAQIRHALEPLQNREDIKNTIQYCMVELDDVLHEIAEAKFAPGIDLTGKTFGQLTVIGRGSKMKWNNACGYIYNWQCRCSCGHIGEYSKYTLLHGKSNMPLMCQSCLNKLIHSTHGQSRTRLYASWSRIKQSCYDPNFPQYKYCGAKGCTVCDEWISDFETFADWAVSHGYQNGFFLCRRNKAEGFNPDNCYWGPRYNATLITIDGETHSITDWCKIKNVIYETVLYRIKANWPKEKLFIKSTRNKNGKN